MEGRWHLNMVHLEDFKSFRGSHSVGPLKPFTAIVGPNGSGKSNLMDAISFVMGEKASRLRVKCFSELVHGASIGRPVSHSASVTAVFEQEGAVKTFTRIVNRSICVYYVDGKVVSMKVYLNKLGDVGITSKSKNSVVFQGTVESIAMMEKKDRTLLLEETSGSIALKERYDSLKEELLRAEEKAKSSLHRKRRIGTDMKESKVEMANVDKYKKFEGMLEKKQVELQLLCLYHTERDMEQLATSLSEQQGKREEVEQQIAMAEKLFHEKKACKNLLEKEMASIDTKVHDAEAHISAKKAAYMKAKEEVDHRAKKLDVAKKHLAMAQKAEEIHMEEIAMLQIELVEVERKESEYYSTEDTQLHHGQNIVLQQEEMEMYNSLKSQLHDLTIRQSQRLDQLNQEQKCDHEELDNAIRARNEIQYKLNQRKRLVEENQRRMERLAEELRTNKDNLDQEVKKKDELLEDVKSAQEKIQEVQEHLDEVTVQLGDAKVEKQEQMRRQKKDQVVGTLKRLFPGVYDRMCNLCQPVNKQYHLAVTRVMGKYMEAIVVDKNQTAVGCISFLKEKMMEPETFLPLEGIMAKPLKERLREIKDLEQVMLVYDVLSFEPEIKQAVLFVTNNTVLCKTPDDACKVAYEMPDGRSYDAVALDGTFYRKSGIISGGNLELAHKAKRWDQKHVAQLKEEKVMSSRELQELMKVPQKESALKTLESQIIGIEIRLKYLSREHARIAGAIEDHQIDVEDLKHKLTVRNIVVQEIEDEIHKRDTQIKQTESEINDLEDLIFLEFCQKLGIANIRQYEAQDVRSQQEMARKQLEFENQKNRISNQLEFQQSRNITNDLRHWEQVVAAEEEELVVCQQMKHQQESEKQEALHVLDHLQAEKLTCNNAIKAVESEKAEAKAKLGDLMKEMQAVKTQVADLEVKLDQKKGARLSLLRECKVQDIVIPLLQGTVDDIELLDSESTVMESRIMIDYSTLPDQSKLLGKDKFREARHMLSNEIMELKQHFNNSYVPNMRAQDMVHLAQLRLYTAIREFEDTCRNVRKAKEDFERVKKKRHDLFMRCFDHTISELDKIYKALCMNDSAQALLAPQNPEEPYLDGIEFTCVPPGKRFFSVGNMSGGEKTLAALALLFAIHKYDNPTPFLLMDEIEASLDNPNISKVANYICENSKSAQVIVVSLKNEFYSQAEALIGIAPGAGDECLVSHVYTKDLTQHDPPEEEMQPTDQSHSV